MGKAELPLHAPGTRTGRGYIGQSTPRANAKRLLQGRGTFPDDLRLPRIARWPDSARPGSPCSAT